MPKIELDHHRIKAMKAPDKASDFFDTIERGLILRLSKAGTKTFTYRYRSNGKNRQYKIGKFPDVSLSEARKTVQQLRIDVDQGKDPQAEKRNKRYKPKEMNFRELAKLFVKQHLSMRKESTRTEYERIINTELLGAHKWGSLPVSEITSQHVREVLNHKAFDEGHFTMANRIRSTISKIFEFGISVVGINVSRNPVEGTAIFEQGENARDRVYNEKELIELWNFFEAKQEPIESLLKMLLICGQRKTETMNMKWNDITYDKPCKRIKIAPDGTTKPEAFLADVWTITDNKSGRIHEIPLPPMAIDVLKKLEPITGKSKYVFESNRKKGQPITIKNTADVIKEKTSVSDFRPHDLRRTVETKMEESGIDRFICERVMNHADNTTAGKHYSWYNYMDKKQVALNRWNDRLERILNGENEETKILKIGS